MNIVEIIKKAPKDHVYYCTALGECRCRLEEDNLLFPIRCFLLNNKSEDDEDCDASLTSDGRFYTLKEYTGYGCILFPFRDNRDWEAFERELDGAVSGKSFFDNTFDGTAEIVSIPDRPMMAAVIMSGMLAGGCKDKGAALVNKALHLADLILDETETKEE